MASCAPGSPWILLQENIISGIFQFFTKFHKTLCVHWFLQIFQLSGPAWAWPGPVRVGPHLIKQLFLKIQYFAYQCLFWPYRAWFWSSRSIENWILYKFHYFTCPYEPGNAQWCQNSDGRVLWIWYGYDMDMIRIWIWYGYDMSMIWIWYGNDIMLV